MRYRCSHQVVWLGAATAVVLSGYAPARAQLDETWTVTVNGQTVQVNPDGTFFVPNISALDLFGPGGPGTIADFLSDDFFRVVGSSTVDGVTRWVFSDPFQVRQGEVFEIGELFFNNTAPPPLPESVRLASGGNRLDAIGQTLQLALTAILADGTSQDVTPREKATVYRTSNPRVATVGPDGLVTATGRGVAFLTAVNGGAAAVTRIVVVPFDPLTTVEGLVQRADGTPVEGAVVTVLGASGLTGPGGSFSIPDVPSALSESLTVVAQATIDDLSHLGQATGLTPIPDGITDAGIITLAVLCEAGWSALADVKTSVLAMAVFDDGSGPALYAGGAFTTAGGTTVNRIARWDGTSWSAVGGGMSNGNVRALTVFDDGTGPALYAGGNFFTAGGVPATRVIARWDGASWSALGSGLAAPVPSVSALTVLDDGTGPALYAGGSFTVAGGVSANHIAKWDGTAWSALGAGIGGGTFSSVKALAVFDDGTGPALYAGGKFGAAGGVPASSIAKWDGTSWSALGSGLLGGFVGVQALAAFDDGAGPALYAGGGFQAPGGGATDPIAKWDGASWSALGTGLGPHDIGIVRALEIFDDGAGPALYAGGQFTTAGGVDVMNIARWDGTSWSALGTGLGPQGLVFSHSVFDDGAGPALYVGGQFTTAGGVDTKNIAKWFRPPPPCPE